MGLASAEQIRVCRHKEWDQHYKPNTQSEKNLVRLDFSFISVLHLEEAAIVTGLVISMDENDMGQVLDLTSATAMLK